MKVLIVVVQEVEGGAWNVDSGDISEFLKIENESLGEFVKSITEACERQLKFELKRREV